MKQADLRNRFKKASKDVHTSTVLVSPDSLSPTPTYSPVQTPENADKDANDPKPAYGYIQLYSPSIAAVTKITCKKLGQCRYWLINWNVL